LPVPVFVTVNPYTAVKLAVADRAIVMVTVHVGAEPRQAPLQPVKLEPLAGVAVSTTAVPDTNCSAQSAPQAMPAGAEVTEPLPVPAVATVSVNVAVKIAVTDCAVVIVTVHGPAALVHAPLQPLKIEPTLGVAVSVTSVPVAYAAVQAAPQLMPAGVDVTTPLPPPLFDTVSVGPASKIAVTLAGALTVSVHGFDWPAHAPAQPLNVDGAVATAVSATTVPCTKRSEQSAPQSMPIGVDLTVPPPTRVTLSTEPTTGDASP
jgi:hypothetical protein